MTDTPAADEYADANLADLDDRQDPHGRIQGWLRYGHSPYLLVVGGRGAGKTYVACAVAEEHRRLASPAGGLPELVLSASTTADQMWGWGAFTEGGETRQEALLRARLLVVDGVGAGDGDGATDLAKTGEPADFFELLEIRANNGLRSVVTTPLPVTDDGYPDADPAGRPYRPSLVWHYGVPAQTFARRAAVAYLAGGSRRRRPPHRRGVV